MGGHLGLRGRDDRPGHGPSVDGDRQRLRLRPGVRRLSRRDGRLRRGRARAGRGSQRRRLEQAGGRRESRGQRLRRCAAPLPAAWAARRSRQPTRRTARSYVWSREDLEAGPRWSAHVGPGGSSTSSFLAQPSYSPDLGMFFISPARDYDDEGQTRTLDAVVAFEGRPRLRASRAADMDRARRRARPEVAAADRRRPRLRARRLRPERVRARRDAQARCCGQWGCRARCSPRSRTPATRCSSRTLPATSTRSGSVRPRRRRQARALRD